MAAQRDFYLSALASAFDSRAGHFAIFLSTAVACNLGCGPCCDFAEGFEAFVFFSEKNDEDTILADFLKKMATAWDGCTAAQQ